MSGIKQLAGQTIWYGLSNVLTRLIGFLLTPILTYLMVDSKGVKEFGDFSLLYAWIGVANIIYTYGLETGYFRFSSDAGVSQRQLFNSTFGSHVITTIVLSAVLFYFNHPIAEFLEIGTLPRIIVITVIIMGFDTLSTIPFAKLRQENRPRRYAFIKVFGVLINIALVVLFVYYIPKHFSGSENYLVKWLLHQNRVTLLVLANLAQAFFVFLFLFPEWRQFRFSIDTTLLKKVLQYSLPMIVIGLAGMVNEVMDRQMLKSFLPHSMDENMRIVGIYSANYKISIFITMFIQAFRMAAEPFFFRQKNAVNARQTYARVMKWFVITLCIAYLFTGLYLHIWQHLIGKEYRSGLGIVPILLMANVFLGIYYNLSAWYKLTDKMYWGIIITILGAVITLIGNYLFIPRFEMYAGATVTMICYGSMVVLAYLLGQKYYRIPYAWKKLVAYIFITVLLFWINSKVGSLISNFWLKTISATFFMGVFLYFIGRVEKKELKALPVIGKFIR
ncbi:lipopolysaccharide biosynthesis protein [Niabella agricola]|uniref:lipopolysaccharide biosynthesis protein n=1 Tax=Niabella agricola TaxID=2891571 RepID=UPI003873440B